jgi:uncharacterized protein with ATP-grasp and redox domains
VSDQEIGVEIALDCVPCLLRQAVETVRMVTDRPDEQERVVRRALSVLQTLDFGETPPRMAAEIHRIITDELGLADPYLEVKRQSTGLANGIVARLGAVSADAADAFEVALRLAIAANVIDFGVGVAVERIEAEILRARDSPLPAEEVEALRNAIDRAQRILYLGDNAGEVAFDRLLIQHMPAGRVTYVVRGGPIINDATREDAEAVGMHHLVDIVDNGSVAPGTILELCSESFRRRFWSADLIIAKGQGNYESLSGEPAPVFFLLKAKCPVIAEHLGCRQGDLVVRRSRRVT